MFGEITVKIPGFSVAARTYGKASGKPVVCFHGMLDNAASFDLLLPELAVKDAYYISFDLPGVGLSSSYPVGILPNWKNDAVVVLKAITALELKKFSIIGHSYGSLMALLLAIVKKSMVEKLVFLDILGPKISFTQNYIEYLKNNVNAYVSDERPMPTVFKDREAAINERMKSGLISDQGARTLASRGLVQVSNGWAWSFDPAIRQVSSSLPHDDELLQMFRAIDNPVYLIRAQNGVLYPEDVYEMRAQAIRDLTTQMIPGGHHVHMDEPKVVAPFISAFLNGDR